MILCFFFKKNMHKKLLEFDCMHENKNIIFYVFEMRNLLHSFRFFFFEILEKNQVFLIPGSYFTM